MILVTIYIGLSNVGMVKKNKLVNDELYSDSKARMFLRRGYSLNKIRYNLIKKGYKVSTFDPKIMSLISSSISGW